MYFCCIVYFKGEPLIDSCTNSCVVLFVISAVCSFCSVLAFFTIRLFDSRNCFTAVLDHLMNYYCIC